MKITRKVLMGMVAEEVRRRLRELHEFKASDEDDKKPPAKGKSKGKGKRPDTASADAEQPRKGPTPLGTAPDRASPDVSTPDSPELDQDDDPSGPAVDGDQPDPEAKPEVDPDAIDPEGDGGEEPSGAVNDEVSGKTIQAVTIEPESEILPGAKEVVLAFNESTDLLRICVTETGQVKFFWRGQLHDIP